MKKGKSTGIVFLFYLAVLLYVLLFAERNLEGANGYNTQLLAEIQRYIRYREILGMKLVVQNLLGNVVGFMPFGFFLPWINQQYKQIWKTTWATGMFSLTVEVIQLLTGVGCFDVDDVLLNTLGGFCGYLLWRSIEKIRKKYGNEKKKKEV